MTIVLVGVGVLTAAVAAGVVALAWVEPSWRPFVIAVSLLVVGATVAKYRSPSGLMLAAAGAREPAGDRERRMGETVVRLAALADLPAPSFAVVESQWANAFSTGIRRRGSVVVTTTALLELLDEAELEAVLAHELAHVANRDAGVMTIAAVPRTLGETMIAESGPVYWLWFPIWWLGIPVWALGSMLTLALSRYREFAADRGSALLTGRPQDLMSALVKLSGDESIPLDDLRTLSRVQVLCVVGSRSGRFSFFADHPPLERRLEHLERISRELGKLVS